ncbi:hypothetical protein B9Z55_010337 [Caenorhabditis nigoni]|nr:hypothetical protein B9Z55_010337 [Caenorhabditis nigoni]
MPLPNFFYFVPLGGIWCSTAPGYYTLVAIPTPMVMSAPPTLLPPTNYGTTPNITFSQSDDEPMHKLEPEKPMDYDVEKETSLGMKKQFEEVDYSDMPQLTRMDC